MLQRSREANVKWNRDKIQYKKEEIIYEGHIINANGIKPDPQKVQAVNDMYRPESKKDVQRLLGMLAYLSNYLPNLANVTSPLRELMKKPVIFQWNEEHEEAWVKIKNILSSSEGLAHFDPKKDIIIETDASQKGIGCALFQEGRPIAYASKSLNQYEKEYWQIEKELYAILVACQKFEQYIYGKMVTIYSDHEPLQTITRKNLHDVSPRMQRMLMKLWKYNYLVKYVPGPKIIVADYFSRAFKEKEIPPAETDEEKSFRKMNDIHINSVKVGLPISDRRWEEIKNKTEKDVVLIKLVELIKQGWP